MHLRALYVLLAVLQIFFFCCSYTSEKYKQFLINCQHLIFWCFLFFCVQFNFYFCLTFLFFTCLFLPGVKASKFNRRRSDSITGVTAMQVFASQPSKCNFYFIISQFLLHFYGQAQYKCVTHTLKFKKYPFNLLPPSMSFLLSLF